VLAGLLVVACGQRRVEIGMVETHRPGQWQARYTTFSGVKRDRVQADAGQTLVLAYEAEIDKGRLEIRVEGPAGDTLWERSREQDGQETVELTLEQGGRYLVLIEGRDTGGRFDLSWSLEGE
jgi:hypothetical protein